METQTRTLIAGEAIREGDPLTCTKVLNADAEGQTFEIGVMMPDDPNGPVGPLGVATQDYAKGEVISRKTIPRLELPGPARSWEDVATPVPVTNLMELIRKVRGRR